MLMQSTFYQFTIKSLLAGVVVGLGCVIYVASPINYVGAFLFSLGLLTIMVKGFYLYTGKVGDWTVNSTFRLIYMFVLNGLGCGATAYLFTFTRIDLSHIHDVVEYKLGDPSMLSSFILAIGCGAMMHIAYYGFNHGNKNPLFVIMPVMFFMLAGFEHSVADCGFFAMAAVDMSMTDWSRLALIMLGNGVGAMVFTKLMPDPDAHGVPPCLGTEDELHIKRAIATHAPALQGDKREVAKRI